MNTWVIVGSSPSVLGHFDPVMGQYPCATTFACNSAIKLFEDKRPDYFIAVDETAGIMLGEHISAAVEAGTQFVSYANSLLIRNIEGVTSLPGFQVKTPMPTILLRIGKGVCTEYEYGRIVFAQYSGLAAMQYAISQGVDEMVILGCDGYQGGVPLVDFPIVTFDGHGGDSHGERQTRQVIGPFMRSMVQKCRDTRFVQYGEPLYTIDAPNYEVRNGVLV